MKPNRSIPDATVIPVLGYPDVLEAAEWLCEAFGFTKRLTIGDHRVQLNAGGGALVVNELKQGDPCDLGHSVMIRVADVDSHRERAAAHGARVVMEPTDQMFGERQYSCVDFAGHHWTFTQTIADVDPAEWGGLKHG